MNITRIMTATAIAKHTSQCGLRPQMTRIPTAHQISIDIRCAWMDLYLVCEDRPTDTMMLSANVSYAPTDLAIDTGWLNEP
jgi:hypothetical protein